MFTKSGQGGTKDAETIIGASVKVEGDFVCEGNMVIDGEVKGHVATEGLLRIGEQAVIVADVVALGVEVRGKVNGNIKVKDFLRISKSAQIFGDVTVQRISIEEGAVLNGKCSMAATKKKSEQKEQAEKSEEKKNIEQK